MRDKKDQLSVSFVTEFTHLMLVTNSWATKFPVSPVWFCPQVPRNITLLDSSPVVQWKEKQVYALFPFQVFCLEQLKMFQLRSNQEAKMNAINVN